MKISISTLGLGLILPIILFLASPYWSNFFSDTKKLEYEVLRSTKISKLDTNDPLSSELQLKFKGNEIPNGTQTTIAIINSGQVPVKREDFDTPINIDIEDSKVLSSQVIKTYPDNLDASISHTENRVTIKPLLLNPRDYILVSLLTDDKTEVSRLHARIAGINSIEEIAANPGEVFAVKHIRPGDEAGTTVESQVLRIPVTAATLICMVLVIVAFYLFSTITECITAAQKIIQICLALVLEITAALILLVPNAYLTRELGLASWASALVELILLAVCVIIALKMREIFYPPVQAS
jgi:hypothetical protein